MKKRKFRCKSWLILEPDILESEAFLSLSGKAAMFCLLRFYQKVFRKGLKKGKRSFKSFEITNHGQIVFTHSEAKELGIRSSRTFHKVLRELIEEKGFVDIVEHGNPYARQPTRFAISERWREYGTQEFKEVKIPRLLPKYVGFKQK